MAKHKRKKIFLYLIPAIFFIGILYLVFNNNGIIKYLKLQNEIDSLNTQISNLEEENEYLKNEIDSLKKEIPAKIEKLAREKYDMIKDGERTIEVKEEGDEE